MGRELRRKEEKKNKKGKERQEISTEPNYSGLTLLKIIGALAIILFVLYYFIAVFITKEVDISGKKSDTTSEESKNSSSSNVSNAILAQRTFEQSEEEYYVYYCDFSDEDKTISSILNNKSNITLYRVDTSSALNQNYVTEENGNRNVTGINDLKVKNPTLIKVTGDKVTFYAEGVNEIVNYLNQ